jgi:hypothetical protein
MWSFKLWNPGNKAYLYGPRTYLGKRKKKITKVPLSSATRRPCYFHISMYLTDSLSRSMLTRDFRSSDKLVSSSLISRITLHNPLPRWAHTYILPFVPLYPAFAIIYFFKYDEFIGSEEWTFVYFGSLITINALCWLCVHWSVTLRALFTATKAPFS